MRSPSSWRSRRRAADARTAVRLPRSLPRRGWRRRSSRAASTRRRGPRPEGRPRRRQQLPQAGARTVPPGRPARRPPAVGGATQRAGQVGEGDGGSARRRAANRRAARSAASGATTTRRSPRRCGRRAAQVVQVAGGSKAQGAVRPARRRAHPRWSPLGGLLPLQEAVNGRSARRWRARASPSACGRRKRRGRWSPGWRTGARCRRSASRRSGGVGPRVARQEPVITRRRVRARGDEHGGTVGDLIAGDGGDVWLLPLPGGPEMTETVVPGRWTASLPGTGAAV